MATKEEWLTARLAYLRGLKSPTEMHKLLMLLAAEKGRNPAPPIPSANSLTEVPL